MVAKSLIRASLTSVKPRALVLTAAVALAAAPAALAASFVIQGDYRIGGYAVKADGSLAGVIDEYGRPTSVRRRFQGGACDVRWRAIGLFVEFYNLGGDDSCRPASGRFRRATMTGRRWRTAKGLRIGDSVARLRRLYPRATFRAERFYGRAWWLVTRTSPFGLRDDYPGLRATVRNGRVQAFVVEYAAGGD
jgi:hypothetical protein